jgi:hypothetical protein
VTWIIGSERYTFGSSLHIVWPIVVALDVSRETDTGFKLALKDVALVEEEHKVDSGQQPVLAKSLPQEHRVLL